MRATVKGVIPDLHELIVQFDADPGIDRGDVVEIEKLTNKRSKNANALYWMMNGKLAQKLNLSGEAIYKSHIRDISCRECYFMETKAVEKFTKLWKADHLGRFVETRESREPGKTIVLAYYDSSDFDRAQMARLIDNCIQDCKAQGIDTDDPMEIRRLTLSWGR